MSQKIAIIGGGISGLTTAYTLEKCNSQNQIELFEKSHRIGGKIQTQKIGPLTIELGPDAFLLKEGSALEKIIGELDLRDRIVTPLKRQFSIQRNGKLYDVPIEMLRPYPHNLGALWRCRLVGLQAKLVGSLKPLLKRLLPRREAQEDPSIAQALRERYGYELSYYLFETVFGGVHSGNADELSFESIYPHLAKPNENSKDHRSQFISFIEGTEELPRAIARTLTTTKISTGKAPIKVVKDDQGYTLIFEDEKRKFDSVIITTAAFRAAELVGELDSQLQDALSAIPHSSSAVITLAVKKSDLLKEPLGTGYLLPASEAGMITGCTYASEKWPLRADKDTLITRIFFGRNGDVTKFKDTQLIDLALNELREKLGFQGDPSYQSVTRWHQGLPQYQIGHQKRIASIRSLLSQHEGLYITGTSYSGIGVPDCIRQAEELSLNVADSKPKSTLYGERRYEHTVCA